MQDEKIASNRKRAVTHTKVAAWVIAGMMMIAGGIIVLVLTRDSQPPEAVAQGQRPISNQNTTTPQADTAAPETPPPPQQEAAADNRSSNEATHPEQADKPRVEQTPEANLAAERRATRGLLAVLTTNQWPEPEFGVELRAPEPPLVCAQMSGADRIMRAHGWRLGSFTSLDELDLSGEYSLDYSRSVGGARLAASLIGDDSRVIMIAMNGLVGAISNAAEHSEAKRKAWELCITSARALLPTIEPTIAEARAAAEDVPFWTGGEAVTSSGWRVLAKDYEYEYSGRPATEGGWLLMLHISRD